LINLDFVKILRILGIDVAVSEGDFSLSDPYIGSFCPVPASSGMGLFLFISLISYP